MLLYYILRFLSINFASRVISAGNIVNIYIKFKSINFRFYYALCNIFYGNDNLYRGACCRSYTLLNYHIFQEIYEEKIKVEAKLNELMEVWICEKE